MINLLHQETKRNFRAARLNVILRRYVFALIAAVIFMVASFGVGYYVTTKDREAAQMELETFQQETAKYAQVKQQSIEFSNNLATTKAILSSEIIFSELIVDISKTLPSGAVLSSLTIAAENVGGEVTLAARTTDANETPLRLKQALEESPLFEKVSIINITSPTPETETSPTTAGQVENPVMAAHPITVNLNVTLSDPAKTRVKP